MNNINVVDTRNFDSVQTIRISAPTVDTHVSGIAFAPDSQSLFIGTESQVVEYAVNSRQRRAFAKAEMM